MNANDTIHFEPASWICKISIFSAVNGTEEFFDNIITGAENMLVPIILLVVTLCFSEIINNLATNKPTLVPPREKISMVEQ